MSLRVNVGIQAIVYIFFKRAVPFNIGLYFALAQYIQASEAGIHFHSGISYGSVSMRGMFRVPKRGFCGHWS